MGGAIGLWIGLSMLSLCELIQLIAELCDYGIHKTCREHRLERKARQKHRQKEEDLRRKSDRGFSDISNFDSLNSKSDDMFHDRLKDRSHYSDNYHPMANGVVHDNYSRGYRDHRLPYSREDY